MAGSDEQKQRVIACDLDGTLAEYESFQGATVIGNPIPEMVEKVKAALAAGAEVWIFTARIMPQDNSLKAAIDAVQGLMAIANWCQQVFGALLPITHEKSPRFTEFWDDRAKEVVPNTGVFATELMEAAQQ